MAPRTEMVMGTFVTIDTVRDAPGDVERAFGWFHAVESCCSRFDENSELMRLSAQPGVPVAVSDMLFEAVRFAVAVARETDGAFDPTVGARMVASGHDREHRTGRRVPAVASDPSASYRDIAIDDTRRTVTLRRPLTLDLGAVAKGLAVDTAARALEACHDFAIDAGGDLFLAGSNHRGEPWTAGIRHPRAEGEIVEAIRVSGAAVCTSGDDARGRHLVDPRTGEPAVSVASVTVIAPTAMLADALATAAFVLGPRDGIALLERHGVDGVLFTPDMTRWTTSGYARG